MAPGDGINSVAMEDDTGRVDDTRLVHAAADDTLVVSDLSADRHGRVGVVAAD
jgi:hypothetical protein